MKHVRDMTPQEAAAALEELKRGSAPEPMDTTRLAKNMSEAERQEWLREHKRRFG